MPDVYYSGKLYPFMDMALALIGRTDAAFYLTGGTALCRHYLHHRYSDDLDLFVNASAGFREQVKEALEALQSGGIEVELGAAAESFVRILARREQTCLKIDFVNDVDFRYGDLQTALFFPRIDHWRNILSNKLCALGRREPKDMADIICIGRCFAFDWPGVFGEARQKDLWVEPLEISRMIQEFPPELLDGVRWVQPLDPAMAAAELKAIHRDIFHGLSNSLFEKASEA